MHLVEEIEISYFRSFYKFRFKDLKDLNVIFGKNDAGKSNIIRAINLFFSGETDHLRRFEFPIDFSEKRASEATESDDVRKFLYVKITFNTPISYRPSLGERFYVKRQWTVSRGLDFHEEVSTSIPSNRRHIVTRFINKVRFIYIPAIKDIRIFEMLLTNIHSTISLSEEFMHAVSAFSDQLQSITANLFDRLPKEVSASTKIGAPTQLSQLFQTLDFETLSVGDRSPKSLIRQRGDGIKVRHIPELLNYISQYDKYEYHIWGFEEPENSLDFTSSQSESQRLLGLAKSERIQIFITTHSPSFYMLDDPSIQKCYIRKTDDGESSIVQGKELGKFDAASALEEGFYLPSLAEELRRISEVEDRARRAEERVGELNLELARISAPVVLTEGRTDARILATAWSKRRDGEPPFHIRSCETGGENAGSGNGGADSLAIRLKGISSDHPNAVIGLFDYDEKGISAFKLDKNFIDIKVGDSIAKRGIHGRSYAACLPAPNFREECKKYKNLPIEFMFKDEYLNKSVEGHRLVLRTKCASTMIGGTKIELPLEDLTHFKDINAGKVEFSDIIVPTLPPEAFEAFDAVFSLIESLISDNEKRGT